MRISISTGHVFVNMILKGGTAPLMILSVKPVGYKKKVIKTEREKPAYHALKNQLKPNTYMKSQN